MTSDVTVAVLMSNSDISSSNPNNQETREMDISFIVSLRRTMNRSFVHVGSSVDHQCRHDAGSSGSSGCVAVATSAAKAASSSVAGRNVSPPRRNVTEGSVVVGMSRSVSAERVGKMSYVMRVV